MTPVVLIQKESPKGDTSSIQVGSFPTDGFCIQYTILPIENNEKFAIQGLFLSFPAYVAA